MKNLQNSAQVIGQALQSQTKLAQMTFVRTPLGLLLREGECPPDWPKSYQPKKHIFITRIDGTPALVIHFSAAQYGPDPDYFERMYQTVRDVLLRKLFDDREKKVFPLLYSFDDQTTTLVMEKGLFDLSVYFKSNEEVVIKEVVVKLFRATRFVYLRNSTSDSGWPRYVNAFFEPEYLHLEDKHIAQYLNPRLVTFYQQVQKEVIDYLTKIGPFKRGFGLQDPKAQNVVRDRQANVLFIDIEKVDQVYHWFSQLGHFYQTAQRDAPNSLFVAILREKIEKIVILDNFGLQLFVLGRINDLCIPLTLRNIAWNQEIGHPVSENRLRQQLEAVRKLLKASTISEALA